VRLVLATGNPHKLGEVRAILALLGLSRIDLRAASDYQQVVMPEETGATFAENARLKAEAVAAVVDEWVIADDSGLVVDALGGKPGVRSARYAGEGAPDTAHVRKLLDAMSDVPRGERSARFVCVVALARQGEETRIVEGYCEGRIAPYPRGASGFGYDPVFEIPGIGLTMSELGAVTKNQISHRSQALARLAPLLSELAPNAAPA